MDEKEQRSAFLSALTQTVGHVEYVRGAVAYEGHTAAREAHPLRLRAERVATYSTAEGLPVKVAGSIVLDRAGRIWAGTRRGPVSEFRNGRFEPRFTSHTTDACAWVLRQVSDSLRFFRRPIVHVPLCKDDLPACRREQARA